MSPQTVWYAVILGGGSGTRMGLGYNKVLAPLAGEPVIRHAVRCFSGFVRGAVIVCPAAERDAFVSALDGWAEFPIRFADGGPTRQASVAQGLKRLPPDATHVFVHDGARCMTESGIIARVRDAALECGAAIPGIPLSDTVKQVDPDGRILSTPDRTALRAVQTPQAFALPVLLTAHRAAEADGFLGTDDASLVERTGHPVVVTEGSRTNLKLTEPEDLRMAEERLLSASPVPFRIGTGYDVHRFAEGRKLILCGVDVPHTRGLDGHSDADVAVHALMDALLGAAALGDIGKHFPDSDERYRGISSILLLRHVCALLREHGYAVGNADVTIVAQAPKLAPYIPRMRETVAEAMEVSPDTVSVKATTTERLGFEGRGEGISAQAVALLVRHTA